MSSQLMPLGNVLPWRRHDVVPVSELLPLALPTQDHLTQLALARLTTVVEDGDVDRGILDLVGLHCAGECLVEDGRATLRLLLGPHPPQDTIPSQRYPDLGLSICKDQQDTHN